MSLAWRKQIHVDVYVPYDQAEARIAAAIAAGGHLVTDESYLTSVSDCFPCFATSNARDLVAQVRGE